MRDIFTDLSANAEPFDAPGFPPDSSAHKGMIIGAEHIIKRLQDGHLLERVLYTFPEYSLVLTGHSLGEPIDLIGGT